MSKRDWRIGISKTVYWAAMQVSVFSRAPARRFDGSGVNEPSSCESATSEQFDQRPGRGLHCAAAFAISSICDIYISLT